MKINLIILGLLCLTGLGWAYLSFNPKTNRIVTESRPAINFSYGDIEGRTGELSDHKNQIILLHFWATWCAPCLVEFPDIIELANKDKENIKILAVSSDESISDIKTFIKKLKTPLTDNLVIIHDVDKNITNNLYTIKKLPETILIDQNLNILKKYVGPQTAWSEDIYKNELKLLLN